jgi:hypothetical protein
VTLTSRENVTEKSVIVLNTLLDVEIGSIDQAMLAMHQIRNNVNNFSFLIISNTLDLLANKQTNEIKNNNE